MMTHLGFLLFLSALLPSQLLAVGVCDSTTSDQMLGCLLQNDYPTYQLCSKCPAAAVRDCANNQRACTSASGATTGGCGSVATGSMLECLRQYDTTTYQLCQSCQGDALVNCVNYKTPCTGQNTSPCFSVPMNNKLSCLQTNDYQTYLLCQNCQGAALNDCANYKTPCTATVQSTNPCYSVPLNDKLSCLQTNDYQTYLLCQNCQGSELINCANNKQACTNQYSGPCDTIAIESKLACLQQYDSQTYALCQSCQLDALPNCISNRRACTTTYYPRRI